MKIARALAVVATALTVGVLAVPTAPDASAVGEQFTGIATRDLNAAEFVAPTALAWAAPTTAVTVSSPTPAALVIKAGTMATVTITADDGQVLGPGWYDLAPGALPSDRFATLRLTVPDSDTEVRYGNLRIDELSRDGFGVITSFSADLVNAVFTSSGNGGMASRELSLRYRSARPYVGLRASGPIAFDSRAVAYPSKIEQFTVTGVGPTPVTLGAAFAEPETPGTQLPFEITSDGCRGKTLAAGVTCTVSARAVADEEGTAVGRVVVPDDTPAGRTLFRVSNTASVVRTGRYHPVPPVRLYDSRVARAPIGPAGTRVIKVAGRGGVPPSIHATPVLSITAVTPTADGYLTVHPSPEYRPPTSSVNFRRGQTRANLVAVSTDPYDGSIRIYNATGTTHVIADVVGWVAGPDDTGADVGSQLEPIGPSRVLDTRYDGGALAPGETADLLLDIDPRVNPDVTAVAVNLTAVAPTRPGFLTAWDGSSTRPNVSALNFTTGATVPVLAFVPVSHLVDGQLRLSLSNGSYGSTHLLVDIVGYFDKADPIGLRLRGIGNPVRIADTRTGLASPRSPIGANSTREFPLPTDLWRTADTVGMLANVTAVRPTARTFLTVWDKEPGEPRPTASNLNPMVGDVVANSVLTGFSSMNRYGVYNQAGATNVIVDSQMALDIYPGRDLGYYAASPTGLAAGTSRTVDSTVARH